MLSKHPERCRYPHGHSRTIEVVVASDSLDANGMVLDFKALKLALKANIDRYDHAMAINSQDPLRQAIEAVYPDSLIVFDDQEPTTEAIAKEIYDFASALFSSGFQVEKNGVHYEILAGRVRLERVRVWETETSWAEYGA